VIRTAPRGLLVRAALGLALLAALLGSCCAGALARPVNLTPPKKKAKPTPAPSCRVFAGQVQNLKLGGLKGPGVTTLAAHHSICSWTGQTPGHYAFTVTVQVSPAPAFLGRRLMEVAKGAARKAAQEKGGDGVILTGSPRHGRYYEQLAYWSEEQPNEETEQCPGEFSNGVEGPPQTAIEPEQSAPKCATQPGLEGNFAEAYGSPRPNYEPMLLQVSVASEIDAIGPLAPARMLVQAFAGHF